MKKILFLTLGLMLFSACGMKKGNFLRTVESAYDIKETEIRFSKALKDKNYQITKHTKHSDIAKENGMYLMPTISITISYPKVSSGLLTCNQSMAIEMPMRISIYEELGGKVHLAYTQPEYWSLKHNIKDQNCIDILLQIAQDFDVATASIAK
ncbi:MAG TPA: DUF302 domain-containing protein [Sulfurovum sp.]|nr:DUF302 domain-containing protein [Sulfurovum sp.]